MVFDIMMAGGSPFITGLFILLGVLIGLFILRIPMEFSVLIFIPLLLGVVGYYVSSVAAITGIIVGIIIGLGFLKLVRR